MLAQFLALLLAAAAPPAAGSTSAPPTSDTGAAKQTTVSPVTVTASKPDQPAAATVEMASDDTVGGDFVAVWPGAAYRNGTDGHVTLNCKVDIHGLAEWCEVFKESPEGKGFGAAALELRTTFKLTPATGPDGPISKMMLIKITFRAPTRDFDLAGQVYNGNPMAMQAITMLNHPEWAEAPSFDDLVAAYPASGGETEGYAVAHCQVMPTGAVTHCGIVKEFPDHHGFGKAAMSVVHKFKVAPQWATAPHSKPLWVDIPIRMAPPSELADRRITAPKWLAGWDPTSHPGVFPPEAAAKGLTTGRGVAECVVRHDGGMADCAPGQADPDGLGFSDAAVKLASLLKVNLWSADAGPVEGGKIRVAIRLNLPPAAKAP